jgi:hypothetical protein
VPGGLAGLGAFGRRYRVVVSFTDGAGNAESVTSAASDRTTLLPNAATLVAPLAPALPGAGSLAAAAGAVALRPTGLTVSGGGTAPITVRATVPAGARTVRIRVFRINRGNTGRLAADRTAGRTRIATVFRSTPKAKRYTFRLTEKPLRNLKPGRYLVEVRVGASRSKLGPATTKTVTVRATKGKLAR